MTTTTTTTTTTILNLIVVIITYIIKILFYYLIILTPIASFFSVLQERKIWLTKTKYDKLHSLSYIGLYRVFMLNITWMTLCVFGSIIVLLQKIYIKTFKRNNNNNDEYIQNIAHCIMERNIAKIALNLWVGPIKVIGKEHLPSIDDEINKKSPAPVYIANHASQIDVAAVYHINRRFRWIAKSSVIYLPGVGQIMYLSQHVFIDRMNKKKQKNKEENKNKNTTTNNNTKEQSTATTTTTKETTTTIKKSSTSSNISMTSTRNLYIQSNKSIQDGIPMFIFPQGTRRMKEQLSFKDGAFRIAIENNTTLIPISINIPTNAWNHPIHLSSLFLPNNDDDENFPSVIITIHKPISILEYKKEQNYNNNDNDDNDPKEFMNGLKQKCFDIIYSVLPDHRTPSSSLETKKEN